LELGDKLVFYVSKPVGGIVGCGEVLSKSHNTDLVWQDELATGRSIYPCKISFKKIFWIPKELWISKRLMMLNSSITFYHGINAVESTEHRDMLTDCIKSNWNVKI
jgi:hypothetical protein